MTRSIEQRPSSDTDDSQIRIATEGDLAPRPGPDAWDDFTPSSPPRTACGPTGRQTAPERNPSSIPPIDLFAPRPTGEPRQAMPDDGGEAILSGAPRETGGERPSGPDSPEAVPSQAELDETQHQLGLKCK
jgi:hypothetical protein